mgnify:CR=1 FL=1
MGAEALALRRGRTELAGNLLTLCALGPVLGLALLRDPLALLKALPEHLEPEGRLLASIPNSAHASIRLQLLEGRLWRRRVVGRVVVA